MRDTHARLAGEAGVSIPITTDAHSTGALGYAELGVGAGAACLADEGAGPEHAVLARDREVEEERVSTFREDGAHVLDWVASYLEGVRERPVLSQRRARRRCAPRSLPRRPTSRSRSRRCSRDLDEVLLPGLTHWQSPRFFAYFATTGSEPGVLAELLIAGAQPGRDPLAHLARAAGARGGDARLARAAARPPGRSCTGTSRTRPRPAPSSPSPPRGRPRRTDAWSCAPSMRTRPSDKAARLLELELRKVPVDDEFRLRPERPRPRRRLRCRRDDRDDVVGCSRSGARDRRRCERRGSVAPRRRRVCRARGGLPGASRPLRRLGACRLHRRQPAQVARRPDGLLRRSGRVGRTPSGDAFSLVPEYLRVGRGGRKPERVHDPYSDGASAPSSSGRSSAATDARGYRSESASTSASPRCSRAGCARRRAGRSSRPATSRSSASAGGLGRGERAAARARERLGRGVPLARAPRGPLRVAARDRQLPNDGGRRPARLGRPPGRSRRVSRAPVQGSRNRRSARNLRPPIGVAAIFPVANSPLRDRSKTCERRSSAGLAPTGRRSRSESSALEERLSADARSQKHGARIQRMPVSRRR